MGSSRGGGAAQALAPGVVTGMIHSMTSAKVAISLPKDVLARARAAVRRGQAASLSAYVTQALVEKTSDDDLMEMLEGMLQETGGPLTSEETRWADAALGIELKPKRRGRRKK